MEIKFASADELCQAIQEYGVVKVASLATGKTNSPKVALANILKQAASAGSKDLESDRSQFVASLTQKQARQYPGIPDFESGLVQKSYVDRPQGPDQLSPKWLAEHAAIKKEEADSAALSALLQRMGIGAGIGAAGGGLAGYLKGNTAAGVGLGALGGAGIGAAATPQRIYDLKSLLGLGYDVSDAGGPSLPAQIDSTGRVMSDEAKARTEYVTANK
jgi:hypothetical protein